MRPAIGSSILGCLLLSLASTCDGSAQPPCNCQVDTFPSTKPCNQVTAFIYATTLDVTTNASFGDAVRSKPGDPPRIVHMAPGRYLLKQQIVLRSDFCIEAKDVQFTDTAPDGFTYFVVTARTVIQGATFGPPSVGQTRTVHVDGGKFSCAFCSFRQIPGYSVFVTGVVGGGQVWPGYASLHSSSVINNPRIEPTAESQGLVALSHGIIRTYGTTVLEGLAGTRAGGLWADANSAILACGLVAITNCQQLSPGRPAVVASRSSRITFASGISSGDSSLSYVNDTSSCIATSGCSCTGCPSGQFLKSNGHCKDQLRLKTRVVTKHVERGDVAKVKFGIKNQGSTPTNSSIALTISAPRGAYYLRSSPCFEFSHGGCSGPVKFDLGDLRIAPDESKWYLTTHFYVDKQVAGRKLAFDAYVTYARRQYSAINVKIDVLYPHRWQKHKHRAYKTHKHKQHMRKPHKH